MAGKNRHFSEWGLLFNERPFWVLELKMGTGKRLNFLTREGYQLAIPS